MTGRTTSHEIPQRPGEGVLRASRIPVLTVRGEAPVQQPLR